MTRVTVRHRAVDCPHDPEAGIVCYLQNPYSWQNRECRECGAELHVQRSGVDTCSDRCRKARSRRISADETG
jgi:hypothetical protein